MRLILPAMRTAYLLLFFLLINFLPARAAILRGNITDTLGNVVPYASVFVKDRSYGVSADAEGVYFIELPAGKHNMIFSAMGFEKHEVQVTLASGQTLVLDVKLKESVISLKDVVISTIYIDRGKEIMRQVRKKGNDYNTAVENYSCNTYQKISVEKINTRPDLPDDDDKKDTAKQVRKKRAEKKKKKIASDSTSVRKKKEKPESIEETNYKKPGKYKVIINAYHDFSDVKAAPIGGTVYLGFDYGEPDIAAVGQEYQDPYLISYRPTSTDFNFYKNLIDAPLLCEKPLLSPLAATAELNYRFSLDTSFYDNGKKIYRILVNPVFKSEPLFSGVIFVEDSTWVIQSVDFAINPDALLFCQEFRINQDYKEVQPGMFLPVRREFNYAIIDGKYLHKGNTRVDHSNYEVNKSFPPRFFNNEVKKYDVNAFNRDTTWWDSLRPITLKTSELAYIQKSDSVRQYLESESYLDSADAEYNDLDIWNFLLTGIGHRNRFKRTEYYIAPLIAQLNPLGIGGYRHMLFGNFNKEFANDYLLETRGQVDYGFKNRDVKGKLGVGLTYMPRKFVRTFIDVGDYYDVINTYPSLGTLFSRANFVRARTISVAQRMEIINGLFGELTLDYSMMDPLTNLQMEKWTEILYGDLNEPTDFKAYKKAEVRIEFKYRPMQKYIIKGNKKIIIGSKFPEFSLLYRKGLNGILNSEVNFDYLESGIKQELQLGTLGYGSWSVLGGAFLNKRSLRVIEYKYFRGSDEWIFSSPLNSFQLLGPTLSASESYFRVNGIYHDQGFVFNKIPVLRKCRLGLAGGAGYLAIPEQDNFRHAEMFAGIEWIFRIRKQLFRTGIYGVTAENTMSLPSLTWKVGFTFFDDYKRQWSY
ncbi:MAG: DUF5686 and carboxypeptidase regulatory-like domain-containing protein [Bacteroidia bacterium]